LPQPEEDFVHLFSKCALQVIETPAAAKSKPLRRCASAILASLVSKYGQSVGLSASLLHLLHKYEHFAATLTEIVEIAAQDHQNPQFVADILREIGNTNAKEMAQDSTGVKNISLFICDLAEKQPRILLPNISVLLPLLDGESHTMRSAIVHAIGHLIAKAFQDKEKPTESVKSRQTLLDVLEQRFVDITSYTRRFESCSSSL